MAGKSVTDPQRLQAAVAAASATVQQPVAAESVTEHQHACMYECSVNSVRVNDEALGTHRLVLGFCGEAGS